MISKSLDILRDALGEVHPSPKILEAIKFIGAGFVETPSIIEQNYYFEFFTAGVSFNFERECLVQISIYLEPEGSYEPFKGDVFDVEPLNEIDFNFVESILGSPQASGGGEGAFIGHINRWIKYDLNGFSINFEFNENEFLSVVHLILRS